MNKMLQYCLERFAIHYFLQTPFAARHSCNYFVCCNLQQGFFKAIFLVALCSKALFKLFSAYAACSKAL